MKLSPSFQHPWPPTQSHFTQGNDSEISLLPYAPIFNNFHVLSAQLSLLTNERKYLEVLPFPEEFVN